MFCFLILLTTYNVRGSTEDVQRVLLFNSINGLLQKSVKNFLLFISPFRLINCMAGSCTYMCTTTITMPLATPQYHIMQVRIPNSRMQVLHGTQHEKQTAQAYCHQKFYSKMNKNTNDGKSGHPLVYITKQYDTNGINQGFIHRIEGMIVVYA